MNLITVRALAVTAILTAHPLGAQHTGSVPRPATRADYLDDWHRHVVRAAGLTPLDEARLPRGDREIRIWIDGGMVAPSWLYRFTSSHGRVSGEIIWYWNEQPAPAIQMDSSVRAMLGEACAGFAHRDDASTCRAQFVRRPPWRVIVDSLDALGVWTIPDAPPPPPNIVTTDGWGAIVELRDGDAYRTYAYDNPGVHSNVPSAAHVAEIVRTVRSLDSLIVPWGPDAHRASPRQPTDTARPAAAHTEQAKRGEDRLARVARAAGLVPLAEASLAPGHREVRIWLDRGLVNPFWMYRLVSRGGRATGGILFYWFASQVPDSSFDRGVRGWIGDSCDGFVSAQDVRVCHGRFEHTPRWRALLDSVSSLGLWTLPDPATLPRDRVMVLDGSIVRVELRDGGVFRSYDYAFPGQHPSWPSDARMTAILRALETAETSLRCRQPTACWATEP